jgi:hypothetical protein
MLKRREEFDTYLTQVCRHHYSGENPVKRLNIRESFQPTLQLMEATVLAESSILYFIFSPGSLCFGDVYRCESGRCRTLPFFLTFFIVLPFQVFLLYCNMEDINQNKNDYHL